MTLTKEEEAELEAMLDEVETRAQNKGVVFSVSCPECKGELFIPSPDEDPHCAVKRYICANCGAICNVTEPDVWTE